MPIVIGMFFLVPLLLGLVLEYLCCRLPRRRIWRAPPRPGDPPYRPGGGGAVEPVGVGDGLR